MATKEQIISWFIDLKIDPEQIGMLIEEMIKDGEMIKEDGLYYLTEKGHYEFMYGKYKEWEPWHMDKYKKSEDDPGSNPGA